MQPVETGEQLVGGVTDGVELAEVGDENVHCVVLRRRSHFVADQLGLVGIATVDDHGRAAAAQQLAGGATEAGGRARHEHHATVELVLGRDPSSAPSSSARCTRRW